MPKENRIAYLGPAGTYSDEAARAFITRIEAADGETGITPFECSSFDEVFDCVERGRCEFGVVPTENSLEGAVTATLDNFAFKGSVAVLGEEVLSIHHCLVLHPDARLEEVDTVASHVQGLAQCRRYLDEHLRGRKLVTTSSTAESARLAAGDKKTAGIANAFAAGLYGAVVHEADIEDHFGNQTSFALIAHQGAAQVFTGQRYKTSLALFLQADKAGALLMILSEFAYAGINLTKIQSRPTKRALGDYMFFIDIEGSTQDAPVQTALNCLRLKLREVKVLGSYPVG
ncbi:MAG: prephenate dehydratase [Coriobacteriaceae bacterium]|jgi:prephenate dehydratase|nr:prephenate dehydratase [Coriobacteriaceae bacterium]